MKLDTEETREIVERARRLGLIRSPADEAVFVPAPETPKADRKLTMNTTKKAKKYLYWTDEEILADLEARIPPVEEELTEADADDGYPIETPPEDQPTE